MCHCDTKSEFNNHYKHCELTSVLISLWSVHVKSSFLSVLPIYRNRLLDFLLTVYDKVLLSMGIAWVVPETILEILN